MRFLSLLIFCVSNKLLPGLVRYICVLEISVISFVSRSWSGLWGDIMYFLFGIYGGLAGEFS